jgi:Protein of unknown function DUF2625
MLAGGVTQFYENLRWPGWEGEVAALSLDQGITTYPPLSTVEGRDLSVAARTPAPMTEVIAFHRELARFYAGGAS